MTSSQWVLPPGRRRVDRSSPWIPFGVGAGLTVGGGLVALFLCALVPLGCYGDQAIPDAFFHDFDPYFHHALLVACLVVVVLLAVPLVLALTRKRTGTAQALGYMCLGVAVLTPWVLLYLTWTHGKHASELHPY